jgi:hypothetical protein
VSGKELHIVMTPFLEKNTSLFMKVGRGWGSGQGEGVQRAVLA